MLTLSRFGPYFVEPIVAGLAGTKGDDPFIASMDVIGCINWAKDFVVSGTASPQLYGICEALYEPELVRVASLHRCCLSTSRSRKSCSNASPSVS